MASYDVASVTCESHCPARLPTHFRPSLIGFNCILSYEVASKIARPWVPLDKVNKTLINLAGGEINSAMENPFFGML